VDATTVSAIELYDRLNAFLVSLGEKPAKNEIESLLSMMQFNG
jgi:hypothetical protein